jgi:hypothetical protein
MIIASHKPEACLVKKYLISLSPSSHIQELVSAVVVIFGNSTGNLHHILFGRSDTPEKKVERCGM